MKRLGEKKLVKIGNSDENMKQNEEASELIGIIRYFSINKCKFKKLFSYEFHHKNKIIYKSTQK